MMQTTPYTNDLGELDALGPRVADTLPAPELLVSPDDGVKVTLTLSRQSIAFFKEIARQQHVPYQRMIRALIDEYTKLHRKG